MSRFLYDALMESTAPLFVVAAKMVSEPHDWNGIDLLYNQAIQETTREDVDLAGGKPPSAITSPVLLRRMLANRLRRALAMLGES